MTRICIECNSKLDRINMGQSSFWFNQIRIFVSEKNILFSYAHQAVLIKINESNLNFAQIKLTL